MGKKSISGWAMLSVLLAAALLLPNLELLIRLFQPPHETWYHIKEHLLADYLRSTASVVVFTALFTIIIGASLAWLVSAYEFPGRRFFRWALILPLAIPPYIGAYTYAGMLSFTGSVQVFLREVLKVTVNQKLFNIMSIPGTIFIFTLFLFPYVYMVVKSFLEKQSASVIESARVMGSHDRELFFRVVMPMSRSVIVAGASLVVLEVLSDYGVVSYYGVNTFSSAIFKSWISFGDIDSAVRLAAMLMVTVILVLTLEKQLRGRRKYSFATTKIRPIQRKNLTGWKSVCVTFYVVIIFSLGFLIPVLQMVSWSVMSFRNIYYEDFLRMILNSVLLAVGSSLLISVAALIVANYTRMRKTLLSKLCARISVMGYSIPGAVVAITMILFFVGLDRRFGWKLSTSLFILIFAYLVRYLAIGYQNIESGYEKIGNQFTEASRTMGYGVTRTFFRIELGLLKPAILSAFALSFVDIIKELPLVLNLRPFNFHTLSTKVFDYANDEMIPESSVPSLVIILVSFLAIYILHRVADKEDAA